MTCAPVFSIVVPVHDAEKILPVFRQTVDSIFLQTFSDWELIFVDDASTDNTADILRAYAEQDSRIRIITHEVNLHTGMARKHGTAIARGKYVVYCDYDDYLFPDALHTAHRLIRRYQSPDLIQFASRVVRDGFDVQQEATWNPALWWKRIDKYFVGADVFGEFLFERISGFSWGKVIKADLAKRVHFFQALPEDLVHTLRLCAQANTALVSRRRFYIHRARDQSLGLNIDKRELADCYARALTGSLALMQKIHTRELFYGAFNQYSLGWVMACSDFLNQFEYSDADLRIWGRMADGIALNWWSGVRYLARLLMQGKPGRLYFFFKRFQLSMAQYRSYQRLIAGDANPDCTRPSPSEHA